ncbi:hypothetical protein K2Y11_07480 [bacterium]|nr:hypothetical protein [bacterium]
MSFLHGRISFERFEVSGRDIKILDETHVQTIDDHAIGKTGALTADGVEVGFTAGAHILDMNFSLEKNIVNDALVFGLRVDTNKLPSDLLKAYTQMELAGILEASGAEYPSRNMRLQAREAAEERLNKEGKTGKFRKMKQFPVLWDIQKKVVLFGGSNQTAIERFVSLFKEAFGRTLTRRTAGSVAHDVAQAEEKTRSLEDLQPTAFTGNAQTIPIAWIAQSFGTRDFLGNEFLMWLWWYIDTEGDTIEVSDGSTVTCMMARTISLECPLAETGKETITSESPVRLPETKRAVQAGKLPRKAGLILVRHDQQYELSLQAETFSVSGGALPKLEKESGRAEEEDRVDQIREFTDTLDLLFGVFVTRRLSPQWKKDVEAIREWLDKDT